MTTLKFDEEEEIQEGIPGIAGGTQLHLSQAAQSQNGSLLNSSDTLHFTLPSTTNTEHLLALLLKQTQQNSVLLTKALEELKELKKQVEKKGPFTVKSSGYEKELVAKAKEQYLCYGPWLVGESLEKLKGEVINIIGNQGSADVCQVQTCLSFCREKYTLWRAEMRKKILNPKIHNLNILEFADKLYAPFKTKEEDSKYAVKTSLLLRKFASENGYFGDDIRPDFWERFVEFVNCWNNLKIPNKWATLRTEDEQKYYSSATPSCRSPQTPALPSLGNKQSQSGTQVLTTVQNTQLPNNINECN